MAQRKCKSCKHKVSTRAKKCPQCGHPYPTSGCFSVFMLFAIAIGVVWALGLFNPDTYEENKNKANNPPPVIASLVENHIVVGKVGNKEWNQMTIYLNGTPQLFKSTYKWEGKAPVIDGSFAIPLTEFLKGSTRFNPYAEAAVEVWIGGGGFDFIKIPLLENNEATNLATTLRALDEPVSTEEQSNPISKDEELSDSVNVPDWVDEQEWTDVQGRKMTAALVNVVEDISEVKKSYLCVFRKPNGQTYEYPVLKLSQPDRIFIKELMEKKGLLDK
jgi:hypothetical protein